MSGRPDFPTSGALARLGRPVLGACMMSAAAWCAFRGASGPRLSPAPPPVLADVPLADHRVASILDVPVHVDLRRLTDLVEREIPLQWITEGMRVRNGPAASIALTRGEISGAYEGGVASLSLTVAYALRTSVAIPVLPDLRVSCGVGSSSAPRMDVRVESPLSLLSLIHI